MKVGLKLWSSNPAEYVENSGFADFIEVTPVSLESVQKFAKKDYEYTIHVPHEHFGFNPILDQAKSQKLLERSVKAARMLKADRLIMHTGYFKHEPSEAETHAGLAAVAKLVKGNSYGLVLIENSIPGPVYPEDEGSHYTSYDYAGLKELLDLSGAGFCLDLEHAAFTAKSLGISYGKMVGSLMKLKPDYFHLSGAKLSLNEHNHHLSIFESDINLDFVKKLLQKAGKPVCLETPMDIGQRKREVEFLKR